MQRLDDLFRFWNQNEKVRFLVVGGWNTLFGYLCFLGLYLVLHRHLHYLVIGAIAHGIAVVSAFVCYRLLVFRSRGSKMAEFLKFILTQSVALVFGLAGLWVLVEFAHLNPLFSQATLTVLIVALSYLAHRRFTFAV